MPKGGTKTKVGLKTKAGAVPWWLSGGEEECPHCGQLYAREVEFRCPDCDGPSCAHCQRKHADDRAACPECVEGCGEAEGRSHG